MGRETLETNAAPRPAGAYSQGMATDGFLWTAGFGPQDPNTGEVPEGEAEQTDQVLKNVRSVLAERSLDLNDAVKFTAHLQHLERDLVEFDAAYREMFEPPFPVRTTVGSDLADILVEIDVVARIDL